MVKTDANRQRGVPGEQAVDGSDPKLSTRAVREYLEALVAQALAEAMPENLSLTDPLARWTAAPGAGRRCLLDQLPHRYRRRDHPFNDHWRCVAASPKVARADCPWLGHQIALYRCAVEIDSSHRR